MSHRYILLFLLLLGVGCAEQEKLQVIRKPTVPVAVSGINGLDGNEEQAVLSYHNNARASVGVPPLVWSKDLAQHATDWSNKLAVKGCTLEHSQNSDYGENIFMGSSNLNHDAVVEAAKAWESEKINYSGERLNKANWSQSGHYTQMVWRNTTQLGCAKAICPDSLVVVCNYNPAGNLIGKKPY